MEGPVDALARGLDVLDKESQDFSEIQRQLIHNLQRSVASLRATVDGLDEVVGIVAHGVEEPRAEQVDPGAVLRNQVQLRGERALAQGTTITTEVSPTVPRMADVDSEAVSRVIGSLLDHALIRAADGSVRADMDFAPSPEPGVLLLRFVWESRPAAPGEDLPAPHALGLAVSGRQIARLHGAMGETSDPDGMWVKLPLMTPPRPTEPGPRAPQPLAVLIVEDDPFSRMMAELQVELAGHRPVPAVNVDEARAALPNVDLVLMDRNLGPHDATDFVREIRTAGVAWSRVPIVGVSASGLDRDRRECLASGMDEYVVKPVGAELLRATVARLIDSGRLPDRRLLEDVDGAPRRAGRPVTGVATQPIALIVDHLHRLGRELGSRETVEQIAEKFLLELPNRLGTLAVAALQRDRRGFRHVAHRFRGAAAVIGAQGLVAVLDAAAEATDADDLPRVAEAVRQEAMLVRLAVRRFLDEGSPTV